MTVETQDIKILDPKNMIDLTSIVLSWSRGSNTSKQARSKGTQHTSADSRYHAHSLRIQYYANHVRKTNVQHTDTKSGNHSEIISHNLYSTLLLCTTNYLPSN